MQRKKSSKSIDPYETVRKQVLRAFSSQIGPSKKYKTIEAFCWENDLPKSTVSRFLNDKNNQYTVRFLTLLAEALGKKLEVRMK